MERERTGYGPGSGEEVRQFSVDVYRKNFRAAVGAGAASYGYTLATWTAVALTFGHTTQSFANEPMRAALWGRFHFFSAGLAIGAASLAAWMLHDTFIWCLEAFLSTTTYLLVLVTRITITDRQAR